MNKELFKEEKSASETAVLVLFPRHDGTPPAAGAQDNDPAPVVDAISGDQSTAIGRPD